jgi:hypothetical protein
MRRLIVRIVLFGALGACGDGTPGGACEEGETRACYTGPAGTEGVGTCAPGIETCFHGAFSGICVGDVTPFVEHCDGLDEDCSGVVDDVEGSGEACTNADGCDGTTACVGASLACAGPDRNACSVCDGVTIEDLGTTCTIGNCSGQRVCNGAGDDTDCNAPAENACALCGGPTIVGLGTDCATSCPGINVCNDDRDDVTCDCNPQPGMCRDNGIFRPVLSPQPGDVVITEFMPNPSGDDTKQEWFEVELKATMDINQLAVDRVGDSLVPDVIQNVDCLRFPAGTRLVFARSKDVTENGSIAGVISTFKFSLVTGSVASPGDIRVLAADGTTVLDAVTWTGSTAGVATQLDPDFINTVDNDDPTKYCDAIDLYGLGVDFGTPGAANAQCLAPGECRGANGIPRAIVKPTTTLVITEFLANPAPPPTVDGTNDTDKEWFEITNAGTTPFDLNGLTFDTPSAGGATTLVSQTCLQVLPGAFKVFARNSNPAQNGGLPTVDFLMNFGLVDSGANASLSVLDGATTLDTITWTAVTSGRALGLDPDHFNVTDNDVAAPTAGVNCLATATYGDGTNQGTPGSANPQCP